MGGGGGEVTRYRRVGWGGKAAVCAPSACASLGIVVLPSFVSRWRLFFFRADDRHTHAEKEREKRL